jgi:tetratricopeptide (TPR) repeat protein
MLICLLFLCTGRGSSATGKPRGADDKAPDYSKEAFVIERLLDKAVFENDGTYSTEETARIKIQSQAAVQALGIVNVSYASATTTVDIVYIRVIKPDGRVVETPPENILDMPAEITRQAPFYSDLKEKQVAVKGLEIGDALEFQYRTSTKTPLDPGQFWFAFNFFNTGICLQQKLEISVPRGRAVKVASATVQPTAVDQGTYRVYTWTTSHLESAAAKKDSKSPEPKRSAVQITSLQDWDEVGQWFKSLAAPRAVPTPQIRQKADEITRNAKTDQEKTQAIYDYVSTKFRYIGVALGIGRYQPHAAADVLSNDYGDCKDKHTLLAALLAAENIRAFPALISSAAKFDSDVPSPGQFDHMITAVPQGDGFLFLDTTTEVGPYGYLIEDLRDKEVLVIPDNGPAKLVRTPKDPPFKSVFTFQSDGTLNDAGTFESKIRITTRSDFEVLYRLSFRRAGEAQWKDVMQQISNNLGFSGTVSDVTITPPDATATPFQIDYTYTRKTFGDWDNRRFVAPLPFIFLPSVPDDADKKLKPLKLGEPTEYVLTGSMKLPANSDPNEREAINLQESFAEYHSKYSVENGVIRFDRRVLTKTDEVSVTQFDAYTQFWKTASDDEVTYIALNGGTDDSGAGPVTPEAQKLYSQGVDAWQAHNLPAAADAFQRAVENEPKFALGWMELGRARLMMGDHDAAIEDMKKGIALSPSQKSYYKILAQVLTFSHRSDETLNLWRDFERQKPGDADAAEAIGAILMERKKYPEAVAELEVAAKHNPDNDQVRMQLGEAYVDAGNKEKGIPMLEATAASKPFLLNNVAYIFAENNLQLHEALEYAQEAVAQAESDSAAIKLDNLKLAELQSVGVLAAYWDTLGWVYFRLGQLDDAEKYLNAAWSLTLDSMGADHLGQLYEKEGKKHDAIQAYGNAVSATRPPDHARERLAALHAGEPSPRFEKSGEFNLQDHRTFNLTKFPNKPAKHASAEFFILFAPGPKVAAVKFITGSQDLRDAGLGLAAVKVAAVFPSDHPAQIIRRGVLDCEPEVPGCVFVLFPPNEVHSVN